MQMLILPADFFAGNINFGNQGHPFRRVLCRFSGPRTSWANSTTMDFRRMATNGRPIRASKAAGTSRWAVGVAYSPGGTK